MTDATKLSGLEERRLDVHGARLRYYVGASNLPDDGGYASKVLAEQANLRMVASGKIIAINVARPAPVLLPRIKTNVETPVPAKAEEKPAAEQLALFLKRPA